MLRIDRAIWLRSGSGWHGPRASMHGGVAVACPDKKRQSRERMIDAIHEFGKALAAGELTTIWVPKCRHEAIRSLVRARTAAMDNVRRSRQQIKSFLLRHGQTYPGKTSWTKTHLEWIRRLAFDHPAHYIVIQELLAEPGMH